MQQSKWTTVIGLFIGILLLFAGSAYSYQGFIESGVGQKEKTESSYISMLFYKLSGQRPDFDIWAEETKEYQEASNFSKMAVKKERLDHFNNFFNLLSIKEPITIKFKTKISEYSYQNKGFFIDSFQPDLFFNYEYMGEHFALIPNGIDNYQWFSVPASEINDAGLDLKKENEISLQLMLEPKYADSSKPARLGDVKYWMILTKVSNIELWSADGTQLLWRGEKAGDGSQLLNLYR